MPAPSDTAAEHWTPRHNPWLIAVAVMLATFMEVLDTSVANVALPHIAGNLSATTDESTWVLTSYLVSNAIVLPAAGWFGNLLWAETLSDRLRCAFYASALPYAAWRRALDFS